MFETAQDPRAIAWQQYQAGNSAEAERLYRAYLAANPHDADVWCVLGIICRAQADLAGAEASQREAIRLRPGFLEAHVNLANVLVAQEKPAEAVQIYDEVLRRNPNHAQAHNNLGVALRNQGRLSDAVASYTRALEIHPGYADAHNNLGDALQKLGKIAESIQSYERSLSLIPDYPEAHTNLGTALVTQGRVEEAMAHHRAALRLRPNYAEAHNNLGNALAAQKEFEQAIEGYRRAIRLRPRFADAHYNLAIALAEQGDLEGALATGRRAIELQPDFSRAHSNLGNVLFMLGRPDDARASYDRALEANPDQADAHMARALSWLVVGDYERGWEEYEWRWKCPEFSGPSFPKPAWDGSPVSAQTILLHAEQGLGDTLQFIRYARLVKERGARVVFACPPALVRLLAGCPGIDEIVPVGSPLPDFSAHAPLLSLPRIFGTTLATVPAETPYLSADPALFERWQQALSRYDGFRIGIAWQGNPKFRADRTRSFPLAEFAAVARVPGVQLFSLQKGSGAEQIAALDGSFHVIDLSHQLDESSGPFMDTAAVMKNLDLVICPNTAIAHLAGGLGVRTWVALHAAPEWRWLLHRDDSPWYPTVRLFRQSEFGCWPPVFARMARALCDLVSAGSVKSKPISIEISPGELMDRITILEIKSTRICDTEKVSNVRASLAALEKVRDRVLPRREELERLVAELRTTNAALWDVEEQLRDCERNADFGARFIELARSVYRNNDRRYQLKCRIDELVGCKPTEEKAYPNYDR